MTKDTKRRTKNYLPVTVPFSAAIPAGELEARESTREIPAWANRGVWTDRMLSALLVGVRGGKWHALSDKVESELNLFTSARKVVGKDGAAGVDRQSTDDFAEHEVDEIRRLHRQLREGTYRPRPVRRVCWRKTHTDKLVSNQCTLVVVRNVLTGETKYFLSNRVPGARRLVAAEDSAGCHWTLARGGDAI